MAILQYWCPTHHTTKRLTRNVGTTFYTKTNWYNGKFNNEEIEIYKVRFDNITPICQVCRKEMVYAGSNLPKKKKKKLKKGK